jgi:hypothetical protein
MEFLDQPLNVDLSNVSGVSGVSMQIRVRCLTDWKKKCVDIARVASFFSLFLFVVGSFHLSLHNLLRLWQLLA